MVRPVHPETGPYPHVACSTCCRELSFRRSLKLGRGCFCGLGCLPDLRRARLLGIA